MPPKKNVSRKNVVQKQKQKKGNQLRDQKQNQKKGNQQQQNQKKGNQQQQQQQNEKKGNQQQDQKQNVNVNVQIGNKPQRARQPRKQSVKQPIQAPIIQRAHYIPMYINQQPAQYFTPPISSSIPIIPPTSTSIPTTISQPSQNSRLTTTQTQPITNLRTDYVRLYSSTPYDVDDAIYSLPYDVDDAFKYDGFEYKSQDATKSGMSSILKKMENKEVQTDKPIPQPPPLPPLPINFIAPNRDTQTSLSKKINDLTQENLSRFGNGEDETTRETNISDITDSADLTQSLFENVQRLAKIREERAKQQTIDEIIAKNKEIKKEEEKTPFVREMEKKMKEKEGKNESVEKIIEKQRQEKIKEIEERAPSGILGEIQKAEGKVEKAKNRKEGSGRPKGVRNKTREEKNYDEVLEQEISGIKEYNKKIKKMKKNNNNYDENDYRIEDYEDLIRKSEETVRRIQELINELRVDRGADLISPYQSILEDDDEFDD